MPSFEQEVQQRLLNTLENQQLANAASQFMLASIAAKYSYNFFWQGRPVIQYPQDLIAMQELIWAVKPDLIIETGIAHGGSLVFSASMLTLLDYAEASQSGELIDPRQPKRRVLGIDIDIRAHNRRAIEEHPLATRIDMLEGSSLAGEIIEQVQAIAARYQRVLVCLDSNHSHDHVLAELQAYAPLTSIGSYCVVFDTIIEDLPVESFSERPWKPGNNPKTAVWEYLRSHSEFEICREMDSKLMISVAPEGYLKRIR